MSTEEVGAPQSASQSSPARGAVFLSYASEDAVAAQRIAVALREAGIEVWFDKSELRGGDAWDRKIRDQIHSCTLFVPVVSANTERRDEGYFRREWGLAVDRTRDMTHKRTFLVPVVIDATPERGASVPDKFQEVQWTRLPGGEAPPAFVEWMRRLLTPGTLLTTSLTTVGSESGSSVHQSVRPSPLPKAAIWAALAIVVLGCAYFATYELRLLSHATPGEPAAASVPRQSASPAGAAAASIPSPHSIAVLPFVNMSGDKEQEYFADGLTEELIDHLAQTSDLKVIARTSSFQFKGQNEDVRAIAAKLAVANLLEGSVRRSGKTLRITAQLVRASDGFHIWSRTYERTLNDIFKVQDDIAETVTRALDAALTQTVSAAASSVNLEAYDLVLQGNLFKQRRSAQDLAKAIALYKQAIQIDPRYALAWARLGSAYLGQVQVSIVAESEGLPRAREALEHAIELDPTLITAHYTMAGLYLTELNWRGEAAEIARMRELDPNDKELLPSAEADVYRAWCRLPEAIRIDQEQVERDPLDPYSWAQLASDQFLAPQINDAIDSYQHLIALAPGFAGAQAGLGQALAFVGRYAEGLKATRKESNDAARLETLPIVYWAQGDSPRSDAAMRDLVSRQSQDWYEIGAAYAYRGQLVEGLDWLERAYQHRDMNLSAIKCDPLLRSLQSQPRYQALLAKLHFDGPLPMSGAR